MDGGGEEERGREEAKRGERARMPGNAVLVQSRELGLGELAVGTCRCLQLQDRARLSLCVSVWPSAQQPGRSAAASWRHCNVRRWSARHVIN